MQMFESGKKSQELPIVLGTPLVPKIFGFLPWSPKSTDFCRKNHQELLLKVYFAYGSCKNTLLVQFSSFWGPRAKKYGPLGHQKLHLYIGCGPPKRQSQTEGLWWCPTLPLGLVKWSQKPQKQTFGPQLGHFLNFFIVPKRSLFFKLSCSGQLNFTSGDRGD